MAVLEPKIHSHIEDGLPEEHPLALESVTCARCGVMVHAFNNECMQTWVESGVGNFCLSCFADKEGASVLDRKHGLKGRCPGRSEGEAK